MVPPIQWEDWFRRLIQIGAPPSNLLCFVSSPVTIPCDKLQGEKKLFVYVLTRNDRPTFRFSWCKFGSMNESGQKNGVGKKWGTTNLTYLEILYRFCIWPRRSKAWQRWNRANQFPTDLTKCNIVSQSYPTFSHLAWATDVVWSTTHTHPPASMFGQCYPGNCLRAERNNDKIVQIDSWWIRP